MKSINMINIMSLFISVNAQIANAFTPLILYYRMTRGLSYNNPYYEKINTDCDNDYFNYNFNKRPQSVIICKSVDDDYECYEDDNNSINNGIKNRRYSLSYKLDDCEDNNYECYADDYLESYSDGNEKPCSNDYYEGYKDLIKYDNRYKDFWDEYYTGNINKDGINYDNKHIIENALDEKNKKEQKWDKAKKKLKKEQPKKEQPKKEQPKKWSPSSAKEHPKTNVDDYPLLP